MKRLQAIRCISLLAAGGLGAQQVPPPPDRVTIVQAVQEAVEHNLSLLAERYNLSIADAKIITAKLRPNPVFSASSHGTASGTSGHSPGRGSIARPCWA